MDAVLKRKTESIYRDVVESYTQDQIDQAMRWVAMALATASEKVPLNEAKVFLMTMIRDCPSEMVELARDMPTFEQVMAGQEKH